MAQLAQQRCVPNRQGLVRREARRPPTAPSSAQSCEGCRSLPGLDFPPSAPEYRTPRIPATTWLQHVLKGVSLNLNLVEESELCIPDGPASKGALQVGRCEKRRVHVDTVHHHLKHLQYPCIHHHRSPSPETKHRQYPNAEPTCTRSLGCPRILRTLPT